MQAAAHAAHGAQKLWPPSHSSDDEAVFYLVNRVLLRGFSQDAITEFGKFARAEGVIVRWLKFSSAR